MEETDIRKYAQLMQELGLTRLEFSGPDQSVRLERAVSAPAAVSASAAVFAPAAAAPAPAADNGRFVSVRSPIVGLFYAAPAENAEPYVSLGDRVKKGQTLCIVEAMKLMNEITAEADGVHTEIGVSNALLVESGAVLFRIQR